MVGRHASSDSGYPEKVRGEVRARVRHLLNMRDRTYKELAEHLGLTLTSVTRLLNGQQWFSFDALVNTAEYLEVPVADLFSDLESPEYPDIAPYTINEGAVEAFAKGQKKSSSKVKKWLDDLPAIERGIITCRYFVTPVATLEELGNIFGITNERVRQIESAALQKLK